MEHNWKPHIYHFYSSSSSSSDTGSSSTGSTNNIVYEKCDMARRSVWHISSKMDAFVCCAVRRQLQYFRSYYISFLSIFVVVHELDLTKGKSYARPLLLLLSLSLSLSWCREKRMLIKGCVRLCAPVPIIVCSDGCACVECRWICHWKWAIYTIAYLVRICSCGIHRQRVCVCDKHKT